MKVKDKQALGKWYYPTFLKRCCKNMRKRTEPATKVVFKKQKHAIRLTVAFSILFPFFLSPIFSGCWAGNLHGQKNGGKEIDLTTLSIEDLMEVQFVTLFKKPGRIFESAAAAYAISKEDIQRTGVTNVPEALRMVPGMQVSQHNASSYAATVRGFSGLSRGISGQFANKLLVMNDGRSIYTPLFSGVSWETQDVLLEDVERIEVIRGPGASLWGANAVNGIINIISKNAEDTQGGLLSFGGGTEYQTFSHFRYGSHFGNNNYFRIYGKYLKADGFVDSTGRDSNDSWHVFQGGFRFDTFPTTNNMITAQGEIYDGRFNQTYNIVSQVRPPFLTRFNFENKNTGGNLLSRWRHSFSNKSEFSIQLYFDRVKRFEAAVRGAINTYDVDFYHRFQLGSRNDIVWGAGYRLISDHFDSTFTFSLNPNKRKLSIFNTFLQDDIQLIRDKVKLTIGSKFEHNEYTGFEIQPNARLFWAPSENQAVWASVSRAVRTPSRGENDARIILWATPQNETPTNFIVLNGQSDFKSETMVALESGYRIRTSHNLSVDASLFLNEYRNLRSDDLASPAVSMNSVYSPNFELAVEVNNNLRGHSYGFEASSEYVPIQKLRLKATYSFLKIHLTEKSNVKSDPINKFIEKQSPVHQFYFQSFFKIHPRVDTNIFLRYIDNIPSQGVSSYVSLNGHLVWQLNKYLKFSLIGQNLLSTDHAEDSQVLNRQAVIVTTGTEATRVQRGVYSKITFTF